MNMLNKILGGTATALSTGGEIFGLIYDGVNAALAKRDAVDESKAQAQITQFHQKATARVNRMAEIFAPRKPV